MPLHTELPPDLNDFDVVIAGGGVFGLVVASRLSDADPNISILVLESGGDGTADPRTKYPMFYAHIFDPTSEYLLGTKAGPSDKVNGREMVVPHGHVLGGGSTVNVMNYSRPYTYDFESWNVPGWLFEDVLPYFKKFENYHGPGDDNVHGKGGPIDISEGTMVNREVQDDFLAAVTQVGFPKQVDIQDFRTSIGAERNLQYISPKGERQDVVTQYLFPRLADDKHPNLHVALHSPVDKVLFDDDKKAVGVVCTSTSADGAKQRREILARRQVVVSCGTFITPAILERSGVGRADVLKAAGVSLVAENKGVGEGFQEHFMFMSVYKSSLKPEDGIDQVYGPGFNLLEAIERNDPLLGWTGVDSVCRVRPTDVQVEALGPEFKAKFDKFWGKLPRKCVGSSFGVTGVPLPRPEGETSQLFGMINMSMYPFSRGHIHITSPEASDPVDFRSGFLEDEDDFDIKTLRYLYKTQREIVRRMKLFRGECFWIHPEFPAGSAAAIHDGPLTGEIEDLVYSAEDDDAIDQFIRKTMETPWHGMGTCKMGTVEDAGVVDGDLNVHGVKGLKVVDLSIVGGSVAANTNATSLMIAEKAADILIKELVSNR